MYQFKTLTLAGLAVLCISASALGQTEDSLKVKELKGVVVKSALPLNAQPVAIGKLDISPMDLPQSMVTLNRSLLTDQQSQRLGDVIKNVNGVYVSSTRGGVQESLAARGYTFGSDNLFKNGARVNSGAMPEVSSLEKIEILKGSAAILYGSVAPGGVVNMVTKKPLFTPGAEVSFRTGSNGLYKPAVDIYGPISKKIAFRVNGTIEKADSYRDVVKSSRYYVNPSLLFNINSKTSLLLEGDYLQTSFTPDFGIGTTDNTKISALPRNAFLGTNWQYNNVKQSSQNLVFTRMLLANWSLKATASHQQYSRDYYSTERVQASATGVWARPLNKIESDQDYFSGSVDLTGNTTLANMQHKFLVGVDADRYNTETYAFDQPRIYDTINIFDTDHSKWRNTIPNANRVTLLTTPITRGGVYVQDFVNITTKLKLLAGVRYSTIKQFATSNQFLKNDSIVKGKDLQSSAWSPRVGIVYQPTKNMSLFSSYSNSFTLNTGTDIFGNTIAPSFIDQYEVGIKNNFFQNRYSVNVTGYKIINSNLAQTAQFKADGTPNVDATIKELSGQTTSNGIEVDMSAQVMQKFEFIAGYSYNNMRYTKVSKATGSFIEGQRLVNTPAHTANGSIWYTVLKTGTQRLRVGGTIAYIGERLSGFNDRQGQTQTYSRLINVKDYNTVDVSVIYDLKAFSLAAKLANVGNTYNFNVHENYSVNPIAPRQYLLTASYKLSWLK